MIRLEEKELEKYILEEDCHIAMPFELHRKGGENEIITYSFTEKTAEEFEKRYCENPFSDEAKKFLLNELTPGPLRIPLCRSRHVKDTPRLRDYRHARRREMG